MNNFVRPRVLQRPLKSRPKVVTPSRLLCGKAPASSAYLTSIVGVLGGGLSPPSYAWPIIALPAEILRPVKASVNNGAIGCWNLLRAYSEMHFLRSRLRLFFYASPAIQVVLADRSGERTLKSLPHIKTFALNPPIRHPANHRECWYNS